ncbi:MAG TPA: DUF2723 domain-containing protein [Kofleriaceae bacterium]|nr:DUF2723 domain-containing protein [Kofleriaceae bacterium]
MTRGEQKKLAASGSGWLAIADCVVFAAAFALYAVSASPALGWLDSPELVAASVSLGVPHSPGHPLPVFLGAAAALVPIGDLALRVNLAAAAAGAAACAVVGAAAREVAARVAPELPAAARAALGAAAALVLAASWAAWSQSVRAEVYALAAALSVAALAAAVAWDRARQPRWLVAAGLAGGLALATHHLIAGLVLVPAGAFVLARARGARPSPRVAAITAVAGIVGLAAFLYLPVRSAAPRAAELDWGAPRVVSRFAWTVSGAMFAGTASAEHASSRAEDAAEAIWAAGAAASAPLALLALLGAAALLLRPSARALGGLLIAVAAAGVAARAVLGFDPETSDHHGYLLPAAAALVLLAVAGAAALARSAGGRARRAAAVLAAAGFALAAGRAALGWPVAALATADASDQLARRELEPLPPRALLLTSYFQTSARAIAIRAVEGTRPDVTVLHRGLLTLPGAREAAARRHPELAALIDAPLAAGQPTPVAELARVAAARPVSVELDPDLDPPAHPHLISAGRFARFTAAPLDAGDRAAAEAEDERARATLDAVVAGAGGTDRADAAAALLWLDFCRLEHYCALGRRAAAREALRRAWDISPGDVMLEERAARCRLAAPESR